MDNKRTLAVMIAMGAVARLLPHPWNFTPMMAMALYAGAKSEKLRTGILATLAALLLSDAVMGFYPGMWYVYAASLIPVLLGRFVRGRNLASLAAGGALSSLLFFLTTNFMFWATTQLYPHTAAGLSACLAAGIPFYGNQLLGDGFYMLAFFGGHALIRRLAQPQMRTA